jgi:hypothetical protein
MTILRIEHRVANFEGWKKAFDSDPAGRMSAGVKRYSIYRQFDDPDHVMIDLEFGSIPEAEKMLGVLKNMWPKIDGEMIFTPSAKIISLYKSVSL